MKFKCADRQKKKEKKIQEKLQSHIDQHNYLLNWHSWFAWHPVRTGENCVWLEKVWRRFNDYDDHAAEYSNLEYLDFNCLVGHKRHFEPICSIDAMPSFPDVKDGKVYEY